MVKVIGSLLEFLEADFENEAVILFAATWCGPCTRFKPHYERASEMVDIPFYMINVDDLTNDDYDEPALFALLDLQSVPTVRYYNKHDLGIFNPVNIPTDGVIKFVRNLEAVRVKNVT